jgi:type I restriction enzyme S subunit
MNAEGLLTHYERIADAPDAIARLRRFILDLAVRGKLVPQDPNDEPASELLNRIEKGKARLMKAGDLRDKPLLPAVSDDKMPFALPSTWRWIRLANIVDFSAGRTPSRNDTSFWNNGDHAWVSIADMNDGQVLTKTKETVSDKARKGVFGSEPEAPGTIIMSFKLTIGKIARLGIPAFHNEAIISIRPHVADLDSYLFKVLPQCARQGKTKGAIKGATLNRDSISNILFPLPPLAEQHRIVAKVDELMALCDRLEAARAEREATRDKLTAASLARLNAPDPETFHEDARFAFDALPALTTRPEQIKQLRQTILNLAVRGKLVPQDPNDEPASELLKRIAAEKARLVRAGALSRQKESIRDPSRLMEELPATWQLIALGEVCTIVTSSSRGWAEFYADNGPGFIRAQNIGFGKLKLNDLAFVNPPVNSEGSRTKVVKGDLFIVITGAGVTNPALLDRDLGEAYVSQHVGLVRLTDSQLSEWCLLCLMAPAGGRAELVERAYGAGRPGLNLDNIRSLSIPVPPLSEQRRVVAKVSALMALCDRLEASLVTCEDSRRRLLDALLAEAVQPFEGDLEQAA